MATPVRLLLGYVRSRRKIIHNNKSVLGLTAANLEGRIICGMVNIVQLPLDVIIAIFSYLGYRDLRSVMLTCKPLKDIVINSAVIWLKKNRHELVTNELSLQFLKRCCVKCNPYELCRISRNWNKGIYVGKIIVKHQTQYLPWVQLLKDEMILSVGHQIRSYARNQHGIPKTNTPIWTIRGPYINISSARQNNDVTRFVKKEDFVVFGNSNGSIAAFSSRRNKTESPALLLHAKNCHENGQIEVSCLDFNTSHGNIDLICSGSRYDSHIKIWRPSNGTNDSYNWNGEIDCSPGVKLAREVYIGQQDRAGALCMQLNDKGNLLCCGLYGNAYPLLLNVETGQKILNPEMQHNICQATTDIQWMNRNTVLMSSHYGMVTLVDTRSGKEVFSVSDPFAASIFCVKTDGTNSIIAGASQHSRCVLYDIRSSSGHIQIYFTDTGRSSRVHGLDFDSTILIAALDRRVSCLNFAANSNAPVRDYGRRFVHMI